MCIKGKATIHAKAGNKPNITAMTRSLVCGVLVPHFIKHKDDAGTSIVTKENDAQDRARGAHEKQASKTIHTTMPNKKTSPCTSPSQEQGVRTPLRTRFLDRTRSFWDLH